MVISNTLAIVTVIAIIMAVVNKVFVFITDLLLLNLTKRLA